MARVMVVEDSPVDRAYLKQILTRAGHYVLEAGTGHDALAMIKLQKPDCVVMDLVMPGMNGFQATRSLTRDPQTAAIPVIVVSAKSQDTDRVWALRQGAREYLIKPVKEADLVGKIQMLLGDQAGTHGR